MPFHGALFGRIGREARKLGEFIGPGISAAAGAIIPGLLGAVGERVAGGIGRLEERISGRRQGPFEQGMTFGVPARAPRAVSPGIAGPPLDVGIPFAREEFVGIPQALPGGASFQRASVGGALGRLLPGIAGGLAAGGLFEGFFGGGDDLPALPGVAPGGIFQVVGPTIRARHLVRVTNPMTGRDVWYRNVGRPILFAGDLRTCKRVEKVARLARRGSRKR